MIPTKETQYLECVLTEEELKTAGQALAERTHQIADLEAQLATVRKEIKAQIERADSERKTFADQISSGKTHREVSCTIKRDYKKNLKIWLRADTGEIAKETPSARRSSPSARRREGRMDAQQEREDRNTIKALEILEELSGSLIFRPGMVKVQIPDSPTIHTETLEEMVAIILRLKPLENGDIEEARDG